MSPRLPAFVLVSIALHALTLTLSPGTATGGMGSRNAHAAVTLNARLEPVSAGNLEQGAATSDEAQTDTAAADEAHAPVAQAPDADRETLPMPDRWFSADELAVRAEPLTEVQISYPPHLLASGIVARVGLLLFIDEGGVVRRLQVASAAPESDFDEAATKAWTDVRFSPARKDGMAVKSTKLLEIVFAP